PIGHMQVTTCMSRWAAVASGGPGRYAAPVASSPSAERTELLPRLGGGRWWLIAFVAGFVLLGLSPAWFRPQAIPLWVPVLDVAVCVLFVAAFLLASRVRVFADGEGAGYVDRLG